MSFGFRLESFSATPALPDETFSRETLDHARAEGVAQGRADQRAEDGDRIASALTALAAAIERSDAAARSACDTALHDLRPILTAALAQIAPFGHASVLERAIITEIHRLSEAAPDVICTISCDDTMAQRIKASLSTTSPRIRTASGTNVEIALDGGRITFEPERMQSTLMSLINEFFQKDASE